MPVGLLSFAASPSVHNGGISQTNFNTLQAGGEFPFINMMKQGGRWGWVSSGSTDALTPDLFDDNGYPIASAKFTSHGGVAAVVSVVPELSAVDDWIVDWSGGGTVALTVATGSGSITTVSGSGTSSPWRITLPSTVLSLSVRITSVGPTDLRLYSRTEQTRLNAGKIFSAKFLERLVEGNFGVLRFLNWQNGNRSNATTWDTCNRPEGYFQYALSQFRADLLCNSAGSGITTNSGADYTVSAPSNWSGLVGKKAIHVVWNANSPTSGTATFAGGGSPNITWTAHGLSTGNQIWFTTTGALPAGISPTTFNVLPSNYYFVTVIDANTINVSATDGGAVINFATAGTGVHTGRTNVTLDVGGTGKIQVINEFATQLTSSGNGFPLGTGGDGSLSTLAYDETLNAWMKQGGSGSSSGLDNGVPIAICLRLCREVGAHPWFVSPSLTCTPMSDWHTELATLCRDTMPGWMTPYIEPPNETWNTAGAFYNTTYANAIGQLYGWGATDNANWYGKALSTIGQAVNAVYGGLVDGTKYKIVCGIQAASAASPVGNDARLKSTKYLLQTPQAGYTATQAAGWCTNVCLGHYMAPWSFGYLQELKLAGEYYVTNAGDSVAQAATAATYAAQLLGGGVTTVSGSTFTQNAHGFVANQPVSVMLLFGGTLPSGVTQNQHFIRSTNLTANTFELALTEGGAAVSGSGGSGTFYVVPGPGQNNPGIVAQNVLYQNTAIWAAGIAGDNAITKIDTYEGGLAAGSGYSSSSVTGVVTGATNANPMVLTLSTSSNQGIRSASQLNSNNESLVAGVYLTLSGFTDPNWTSLNGTTVLVNGVSGGTITTNHDASARAGNLASGTATATYVLNSGGTTPYYVALTALRYALKNAPLSQDYLTADYDNMVAISQGAISGGRPGLYKLGGTTSTFGVATAPSDNWWSILENVYTTGDPPQWKAIKAFNN